MFQFVTDHFFEAAKQAINSKGKFNVAVSGGSTPVPFFKALASQADSFEGWHNVNFFWVDERWVPLQDPQNNFGEAMRAGLNKVPAIFYPFDTTLESPEISSKHYAEQINHVGELTGGLDLILLGAGTDSHTASVFSNNLTEAKSVEATFVTRHPDSGQIRLSLSLTTIASAAEVWLILTGEEKRNVLESFLMEPRQANTPVQFAIFAATNPTIVTDIHG